MFMHNQILKFKYIQQKLHSCRQLWFYIVKSWQQENGVPGNCIKETNCVLESLTRTKQTLSLIITELQWAFLRLPSIKIKSDWLQYSNKIHSKTLKKIKCLF